MEDDGDRPVCDVDGEDSARRRPRPTRLNAMDPSRPLPLRVETSPCLLTRRSCGKKRRESPTKHLLLGIEQEPKVFAQHPSSCLLVRGPGEEPPRSSLTSISAPSGQKRQSTPGFELFDRRRYDPNGPV